MVRLVDSSSFVFAMISMAFAFVSSRCFVVVTLEQGKIDPRSR